MEEADAYGIILEHIAKAFHITPQEVEAGMQDWLAETWRGPETALSRDLKEIIGPKVPTPRELHIKMRQLENQGKRSVLIYRPPPKSDDTKKEDGP